MHFYQKQTYRLLFKYIFAKHKLSLFFDKYNELQTSRCTKTFLT